MNACLLSTDLFDFVDIDRVKLLISTTTYVRQAAKVRTS
ncbi:hypothetical protein EV13_0437 [Prochlorococcus sp. MIT 0702]|nr:hypothetical protein EV13_0437 [Prochlorococcus sp. MIT 0702]